MEEESLFVSARNSEMTNKSMSRSSTASDNSTAVKRGISATSASKLTSSKSSKVMKASKNSFAPQKQSDSVQRPRKKKKTSKKLSSTKSHHSSVSALQGKVLDNEGSAQEIRKGPKNGKHKVSNHREIEQSVAPKEENPISPQMLARDQGDEDIVHQSLEFSKLEDTNSNGMSIGSGVDAATEHCDVNNLARLTYSEKIDEEDSNSSRCVTRELSVVLESRKKQVKGQSQPGKTGASIKKAEKLAIKTLLQDLKKGDPGTVTAIKALESTIGEMNMTGATKISLLKRMRSKMTKLPTQSAKLESLQPSRSEIQVQPDSTNGQDIQNSHVGNLGRLQGSFNHIPPQPSFTTGFQSETLQSLGTFDHSLPIANGVEFIPVTNAVPLLTTPTVAVNGVSFNSVPISYSMQNAPTGVPYGLLYAVGTPGIQVASVAPNIMQNSPKSEYTQVQNNPIQVDMPAVDTQPCIKSPTNSVSKIQSRVASETKASQVQAASNKSSGPRLPQEKSRTARIQLKNRVKKTANKVKKRKEPDVAALKSDTDVQDARNLDEVCQMLSLTVTSNIQHHRSGVLVGEMKIKPTAGNRDKSWTFQATEKHGFTKFEHVFDYLERQIRPTLAEMSLWNDSNAASKPNAICWIWRLYDYIVGRELPMPVYSHFIAEGIVPGLNCCVVKIGDPEITIGDKKRFFTSEWEARMSAAKQAMEWITRSRWNISLPYKSTV